MATNTDTQAYLAELKTPSLITGAAVRVATKLYAQTNGDLGRQIALLAKLLQLAEIAEQDDALRGLFEEGFQKFGALERQATEMERLQREVVRTFRDLVDWDARVRVVAGALGYTI
jgi:hypothetical protein